MSKWILSSMLVAAVAVVATGCTADTPSSTSGTTTAQVGATDGHDHGDATFVAFCGTCGHGVEGDVADHKCDTDHATCKCGFHKGSELCCKEIADGEGKFFCAKCGEEAGTESCCKEDAEKCEKCGLHKGSALCCKLAKADDDHAEEDESTDEAPEDTEG